MDRLAKEFSDYTLICTHNNQIMGGETFREISDGFQALADGKVQATPYNGSLCYPFEGFSIVI